MTKNLNKIRKQKEKRDNVNSINNHNCGFINTCRSNN